MRTESQGERRRILVVEDSPRLRRTLARALADRANVVTAGGVADARATLACFPADVIVIDVALPDGDAFDVLRDAQRMSPMPAIVAMSGVASPEQAFRLAQLGVRVYLSKPITLARVEQAIERVLAAPPDLTPHLRSAVGHVPLPSLEQAVRNAMLSEALAKSGGSRRGAARLLRVSRQLVQHMIRADR